MKNWGFTTNIELMVPGTNKVYAIERMTSDYAERHPFDVDAFINEVYEKWFGIEATMDEANQLGTTERARIREFFNYGLGRKGEKFSTHCPAKHTDRVVKDPKTGIGQLVMGKFPDYVNGCEPALIEAWNKGAEYHTKGFRMGDTLPDRLPMCKITCQADGSWVALFPKELHLLDEPQDEPVVIEAAEAVADPLPCPDAAVAAAEPKEEECILPNYNFTHSEEPKPEPVQPCEIESTAAFTEPDLFQPATKPEIIQTVRQRNAEARRRRREEREAKQRAYEEQMEREAQEAEQCAREQEQKKIFAAVGAAVITLVLIYFFGLLGPAVFGLLAGGVLKG